MLRKGKKKDGDADDKAVKKTGLLSKRPKLPSTKTAAAKKEKEATDGVKPTDAKKTTTTSETNDATKVTRRSSSETAKSSTPTKTPAKKSDAPKKGQSVEPGKNLSRVSAPVPGAKGTTSTSPATGKKKPVKPKSTEDSTAALKPAARAKSESSKASPSLSERSVGTKDVKVKKELKSRTPTGAKTPPLPKSSANKDLSSKTTSPATKTKTKAETPVKEKKGAAGLMKKLKSFGKSKTPSEKPEKKVIGGTSGRSSASKGTRSPVSVRKPTMSPAPAEKQRRSSTTSIGARTSPSVSEKGSVGKKKTTTTKVESQSVASTMSPAPESEVKGDAESIHLDRSPVTTELALDAEPQSTELTAGDASRHSSASPVPVEERKDLEKELSSEADKPTQNEEESSSMAQVAEEELAVPGSSHGDAHSARTDGVAEMEPPEVVSTRSPAGSPRDVPSLDASRPESPQAELVMRELSEDLIEKKEIPSEAPNATEDEKKEADAMAEPQFEQELGSGEVKVPKGNVLLTNEAVLDILTSHEESALDVAQMADAKVENRSLDGSLFQEHGAMETASTARVSLDTDGASAQPASLQSDADDVDSMGIEGAVSEDRVSLDSGRATLSGGGSLEGEGTLSTGRTSPESRIEADFDQASLDMGGGPSDGRSSLDAELPLTGASSPLAIINFPIDSGIARNERFSAERDTVPAWGMVRHTTEQQGDQTSERSQHEDVGSFIYLTDVEEENDVAQTGDLEGFSESLTEPTPEERTDDPDDDLTAPDDGYAGESLTSTSWSSSEVFPSEAADDLESTPDPSFQSDLGVGELSPGATTVVEDASLSPLEEVLENPAVVHGSPSDEEQEEDKPALTPENPERKAPVWDPLGPRKPTSKSSRELLVTDSLQKAAERKYLEPQAPELKVTQSQVASTETTLAPAPQIAGVKERKSLDTSFPPKKSTAWDPLKQNRRLSQEAPKHKQALPVMHVESRSLPSVETAKQNRMPLTKSRPKGKDVDKEDFVKPDSSQHHSEEMHDEVSVGRRSSDNPPAPDDEHEEQKSPKRKKGNLFVSCALYVIGGLAVTVLFLRKRGG